MSKFEVVIPPALQGVYDAWHFAPATLTNGLLFCSGIIGTSPDGEAMGKSHSGGEAAFEGAQKTLEGDAAALADIVAIRDPEAQFDAAFEGVKAVLAAAGAGLPDIVELTTYHVDIGKHMPLFMTVKDRHLQAPYPAWTAIGVAELVIPGGLVELRVVAAA